jgi:hypothetical protein
MTSLTMRSSGRPSRWRFCAAATALNKRFHFALRASLASSVTFSTAMRFEIWWPRTASPNARQTISTVEAENGGGGFGPGTR